MILVIDAQRSISQREIRITYGGTIHAYGCDHVDILYIQEKVFLNYMYTLVQFLNFLHNTKEELKAKT